jgi:SET domain-containing protein
MKSASRAAGVRCIPPEISAYNLRMGRSAINRRGVFAMQDIPRNHQVIEYAGERLTWPQALRSARKLRKLGKPPNLYLARLNRRWIINGAVGGNLSRFINHCCDPNLDKRAVHGRLLFFSRREIRAGQELTFDYRFRRDSAKMVCHCGSPKCRGTINLR